MIFNMHGYASENLQSTITSKPINYLPVTNGFSSAFEATAEQHRNCENKIDGYNGNIGVSVSKKIADNHSAMILPKLRWQKNDTETHPTRLNEIYYKLSGSLFPGKNRYDIYSNYETLYIQDLGEYSRNDYWGTFVFVTSLYKPITSSFSLFSLLKYEVKARKKSLDYLTRDYYAFLIAPTYALFQNVQLSNAFRLESLNSIGGIHYLGVHLIPSIAYQVTRKIRFNLETTLVPYNGNSEIGVTYNHKWTKTNVYNLLMVIELF